MPTEKIATKFANGIRYVCDVTTYTKSDLIPGKNYSFLFGTIGILHPVIYSSSADPRIIDEILVRLNEVTELTEFGSDWMTVTTINRYIYLKQLPQTI